MYTFDRSISKADHVRRYTIRLTPVGWEVSTEQNRASVKRVYYADWHRVERAKRTFVGELEALREEGWAEIGTPVKQ
jgi:hypothetical protein